MRRSLSDAALDWLIRKEIPRASSAVMQELSSALSALGWSGRSQSRNPKLTSKLDVPEVYKAEAHRIAGENRAQVAQAGCCEGRSVFSSALSRLRGRSRQNPGNYGGLTSGFDYLDQPRAMLAQHLLWLTRHTPRQNRLTE